MRSRCLLIGTAVLFAAGSLLAQATNPPVSAVVTGGALAISDNGASLSFATTLDGTDQPIGAAGTPPVFTMTDARGLRPGTVGGWNVTIQMTDLDAGGGSEIIPAASMSFTTAGGAIASISGHDGAGDVPTKVTFAGPIGSAQKIITTADGKGRGRYTYTSILTDYTLTIPAETIADTYTGTLTATIVAGP